MNEREKQISRVTWFGMAVNAVLTSFKLLAGILGKSSAMVADGVHSLSDFISDIVVLVFLKISGKSRDKSHDFGHGKFETMATFILSIILIVVAARILAQGVENIRKVLGGETVAAPGKVALIAAIVSILGKEMCFRVTAAVGRRQKSPAVMANAWHHRSDALSSIGSLIGIAGAIVLGSKWVILDPIMGCIISIVIFVVAVKMALPSAKQLLDVSLPDDVEKEILSLASSVEGVEDVHNLKTRQSGPSTIIDMHILVNHTITIVEAHHIATEVEKVMTARYGRETQINVHVEPDNYSHDNHE